MSYLVFLGLEVHNQKPLNESEKTSRRTANHQNDKHAIHIVHVQLGHLSAGFFLYARFFFGGNHRERLWADCGVGANRKMTCGQAGKKTDIYVVISQEKFDLITFWVNSRGKSTSMCQWGISNLVHGCFSNHLNHCLDETTKRSNNTSIAQ